MKITNWNALPLVLDIDTAASISGFHPEYLRQLARAGQFPATQNKKKGKWRVEKQQLRAWVESQTGLCTA